jgi:hypothetical protein
MIERTNSWHNRSFRKLAICTERRIQVIDALITLANTIIHHPPAHPPRQDHPPLRLPPHPTSMTYL